MKIVVFKNVLMENLNKDQIIVVKIVIQIVQHALDPQLYVNHAQYQKIFIIVVVLIIAQIVSIHHLNYVLNAIRPV